MARLNSDQRLWRLAFEIAKSGTCGRVRHGCVVANRNGIILATGYNGSVDGEPHCEDVGCEIVEVRKIVGQQQGYKEELHRTTEHCVRTIHAEKNTIVNAAITGISIARACWYVTGVPCWECSKMIARTGPWDVSFYTEADSRHNDQGKILLWWQKQFAGSEGFHLRSKAELVAEGVING